MDWPNEPETSPATPWSPLGIISTVEANGGSDVSHHIVKQQGNERMMDRWATGRLIDWAAGNDGDEKTKTKLHNELQAVAADLAGPNPSPVEVMLADAAATCWFALRMHEAHYAGCKADGEDMTLVQSEHSQRRMDRAHRRLLSTLKTLATVRRLALPAVQINVAPQQVNQVNVGESA
jgi:hypothetical protein